MEVSSPLLRLERIDMTYHRPTRVDVLHQVDIDIVDGEYVSIMGRSGAGKSTILNLIGLIERPTCGAYIVEGLNTTTANERTRTTIRARTFGFIFQSFHLLPSQTAIENVELGLLYSDVARRRRRSVAEAALHSVELSPRRDALARTLSGGEQQRVAIARAMVAKPKVLLCDEPTGNLDSETSRGVIDLLEELNRTGLCVVVVTHDHALGARAPRRITMADGRVINDETTSLRIPPSSGSRP